MQLYVDFIFNDSSVRLFFFLYQNRNRHRISPLVKYSIEMYRILGQSKSLILDIRPDILSTFRLNAIILNE
jgi:hypothetical protein